MTIDKREKLREGLFIIDELPSPAALVEYSKGTRGNWSMSDIGLSHNVGSYTDYYVLRSSAQEQVKNAARVAKLTGTEPVYSYGAQARRLLKWLNWSAPYDTQARERLASIITPFHFQHCQPWTACPGITMYDLKGAYWQMVKRMPTPLVQVKGRPDKPRVVFCPITDAERAKHWKRLHKFIDDSPKLFRLVFVGCCVSGVLTGHWTAYHDGRIIQVPARLSGLAGMAALAIRSTYEVTQLQARAFESRYANADCCTTEKSDLPAIWDELGLLYDVRASGPGDLRAVGVYKIGEYETDTYATIPNGRWFRKTEGVDVPCMYHKTFL